MACSLLAGAAVKGPRGPADGAGGEEAAASSDRLIRNPLLWALVALVGIYAWQTREVRHGPGRVAPERPGQERIDIPPFEFRGARLLPRARFHIEARVLATERYYLDPVADLSPVDVALGWGPMSDEAVLDQLDISQGERFVYALPRGPLSISPALVQLTFSNFHVIPADALVERELKSLRRGQVVRLAGLLVDVDRPGAARWRSSLARTDFGSGACEILFATELAVR
jgi:hypothetical protein